MNKDKARQKAVAMLLVFMMMMTIMPTAPVFAANAGAFTVTGGTNGTDYSYANGVLTVKTATPITIANTNPNTATTDRIVVQKGVSANITLAGVNIDVTNTSEGYYSGRWYPAFKIEDDSTGNVTITLADGSENILKGGYECAGLQKNGWFETATSGCLTIQGNQLGTGKLLAVGGGYSAGIGGGGLEGCGTQININNCIVTAHGGVNSAGIGGANQGNGFDISITNAIVVATGGDYGAGIGGGLRKQGSYITLRNSSVTATGGKHAAGIGCGKHAAGGVIYIDGGSTQAIAGEDAYAFGSGWQEENIGTVAVKHPDTKNELQLLTIANPNGSTIKVDGKVYGVNQHSDSDTNVYAYLEMKNCTVATDETIFYRYENGAFVGTHICTDDNSDHKCDGCNKDVVWINFDSNGGTGTMEKVIYKKNTDYPLPAATFNAPSTQPFFEGWATSKDGDVITASVYNVTGDITFYAVWRTDGQTTLDVSKGNIVIGENTLSAVGTDGSAITTPNPNGYIITGESTTNTIKITEGTHNITLQNVDIVSQQYGGCAFLVESGLVNVTLNGNNILTSGEGYSGLTLKGRDASLYITSESTGSLKAAGGKFGTGIGASTDDINYGDITIAGGRINSIPGEGVSAYIGTAYYITNNHGAITILGGQFTLGNVEAGTVYNVGVAEGCTVTQTDDAIYPYLVTPPKYTVSFDVNGGTDADKMVSVDNVYGSYTLPTCEFTAPVGMKFKGWAYEANGDVIDTATIDVKANTTLFAIWETAEDAGDTHIHAGGIATCIYRAVCANCGERYGELNATNHASDKVTYNNTTEGTHEKTYDCCQLQVTEACSDGTATCTDKAVCNVCNTAYGALAAHTYGSDNICTVCGDKKATTSTGGGGFSGSYNYPVTTPTTDNGSVTLSDNNASAGETVTATVKPDKGYGVAEVIVTDEDGNVIPVTYLGNGEYSFVMPAGKVNIETVCKPAITLTIGSQMANVFGKDVKNDVAPIITAEGRTMLPIRFIAEALGADVSWNEDTQTVTITKDDTVVEIIIGADYAYINGKKVTLDAKAFIANGRTYLPVRFVAETLGADVNWDADAKQVVIMK